MPKALGAALVAGALLVAGSAVAADDVVNVYSSRHYDTDTELFERFTAETGIEVRLVEGDADELIERIKLEGGNSPADVLLTVDAGRLFRAEQAGILQPAASAVLNERIPAELRHPDGLWFGLTRRIRAIVRSTERVGEDEVKRYEDLAEPAFEDRVCIRSSSNIYNQSLVASMIESDGPEAAEAWVEGLVKNMARPPQGGDRDQIRAVAAGECDVAVINHYYLVRMIEGVDQTDRDAAEKVQIVFPNQADRGAHANISGGAVVAHAPHRENAVRLLEWLTSAEAQAELARGNYEYPVVPDVAPDPALEKLGAFETDAVNASRYGVHNAEAVKMMDRAGWR